MIRYANEPIGNIDGPKLSGDCIDYKNNKLLACSYHDRTPIQIFDLRKRSLLNEISTGDDVSSQGPQHLLWRVFAL